ncbi:MAG: cyclase [Chloroflexi bacterium]|nr:cyclase [Chloroflexota bacterium]
MEEIRKLLKEIGPGRMSSTAYDTSWVARLNEIDPVLSNRSLEWISENQLPDGSWGAKDIYYYHDRVICTLGAMIALTHRGRRAYDKAQIEKGLFALENITAGATGGLASDPNGATVGFEMIVPTLVAEAEKLGIIKQQGNRILGRMSHMRAIKIGKLAGRKIDKQVTPAFSCEMAGVDGQAILNIDDLQESNGSVGNSPSATAYFAMSLKHQDQSAMQYIHEYISADGGSPNVAPFDIFEPAWVLWNLSLISNFNAEADSLYESHLDFLQDHWSNSQGIGHASEYTPKDSDDSGLVFDLLTRFGRKVDIEAILKYEESEFFRCFELEANPSISANIHVLGALQQAGFDEANPSVQKILKFLRSRLIDSSYWFDKWHASPYYATSHGVILCQAYAKDICAKAIQWILNTQNEDGSWGIYKPTAEETAYALQALSIWRRSGGAVPRDKIKQGLDWLEEYSNAPYEPLWIGKALYCPELVVRSTILSAIILAKEE